MSEEKNIKNEPWYAPTQPKESPLKQFIEKSMLAPKPSPKNFLSSSILQFVVGIILVFLSGISLVSVFWPGHKVLWIGIGLILFVICFLLGTVIIVRVIGSGTNYLFGQTSAEPVITTGINFLQKKLTTGETRKSVPAPEMALLQFVQQVRAYAIEATYQKNRDLKQTETKGIQNRDVADLLKRRWNEVLDSLNEFEIYLANDPALMIEKIISKSPAVLMDVSQIFRDVAESFDTTWRRKGINIESAIVTPLKAVVNEALLRRLLIGPWRASAYFARRGSGVVFSAKSIQGKVIAAWECNGLSVPDSYLEILKNSSLPVNSRIERGMSLLSTDPLSPNTFHALVSLITWVDLANAAKSEYKFKHTNEGFVIELRLSQ